MNIRNVIVWLAAIGLATLFPVAALAQTALELSPYPSPYGGEIIEVPPGDVETLWFHIVETGLWHVEDSLLEWVIESGTNATVTELEKFVQPTTEYTGSVWYKYGTIRVDGTPCTTVAITITLDLQQPTGSVTSNTIYKHIEPEPSSLLVLGAGALGLLRRRRCR